MNRVLCAVLSICVLAAIAPANATAQQNSPCMPGMQMPGCTESPTSQPSQKQSAAPMVMNPGNFIDSILAHTASGTSAEPVSTPTPMLMTTKGPWMLMFHANAFLVEQQQTSARGGDKFFSANCFMPMAQRKIGAGFLMLRGMFSLEPATVTGRRYPLLFQQGETAYGLPIADGQHPHNFFMELAVLYDLRLGKNTLISAYVAPVGDPALGPTAFPHRASAFEDPLATLGHHQQDSTHIADDVITGGLTYRDVRIEASGFHGREPDEHRWKISQRAIDSWSTRLTIEPGKNWSAQYSYAHITSPEALFAAEDQNRMTASLMYNRPFHAGNWASTLLWGRTSSLQEDSVFNSYLLESTVRFHRSNYVWTRVENAERSNELLVGENPLPPGFEERPIGRVGAYTVGYDREVHWMPHLASAVGAQFTAYGAPNALKPIYGTSPWGVAVFFRIRPARAEGH